MPKEREVSSRIKVLSWICVIAVGFHFAMVMLFLMPVNPVTLQIGLTPERYVAPFFQQNWQLFSPDPLSTERGLLVRAKIENPDGNTVTTEFYDFTSPLISELQSTRLFPPLRTRISLNLLQTLGYSDPILNRLRLQIADRINEQTGEEVSTDELIPLADFEREVRHASLRIICAMSLREAARHWKDAQIKQIQVRIVVNDFPPFSERHSKSNVGNIFIQDIEWMNSPCSDNWF